MHIHLPSMSNSWVYVFSLSLFKFARCKLLTDREGRKIEQTKCLMMEGEARKHSRSEEDLHGPEMVSAGLGEEYRARPVLGKLCE